MEGIKEDFYKKQGNVERDQVSLISANHLADSGVGNRNTAVCGRLQGVGLSVETRGRKIREGLINTVSFGQVRFGYASVRLSKVRKNLR